MVKTLIFTLSILYTIFVTSFRVESSNDVKAYQSGPEEHFQNLRKEKLSMPFRFLR